MKNYFFSAKLFFVMVLLSCNNKNATPAQDSINNKRRWLKDYALCSCIKYSFKEDTLIKNDLSFSIYLDISDYGKPSIYKTIDSLSKNAALNITPSQIADYNGRKASLNGCINFYESNKLDSTVKSYDSTLSKHEQ